MPGGPTTDQYWVYCGKRNVKYEIVANVPRIVCMGQIKLRHWH